MRLGIDVDGVLANYTDAYQKVLIDGTGKDLFAGTTWTSWDHDRVIGYTEDDCADAWDTITANPRFWSGLSDYPESRAFITHLAELPAIHDIYFITARQGIYAKHQTEQWLSKRMNDWWTPTVLLSASKTQCVNALSLTHYVDDNWGNAADAAHNTAQCTVFLLDQPWNQYPDPHGVIRITSLFDMFR